MGSAPFANNWAYLETELNWLERLLLVAVSQQRKNLKSVTRVAKTSADKATSDWWQGLIAVKNRAYDDTAQKPKDPNAQGYQKTLDQRIFLSRVKKVNLGLPTMQMALGLSLFEKKLVLMAIAPEVQVRYGKLYHYLQTGVHCATGALPTVELALRVLCRNELERRRARTRLSGPNSLLERGILRCVGDAPTLLGSQLQLAPEWVEYLLSENPDPGWPVQFILSQRSALQCRQRLNWSDLIVADEVKQRLRSAQSPLRLLLTGEEELGKDHCAIALATHFNQPLHILDLAQVSAQDELACIKEFQQIKYPILLIKSAHRWLGRSVTIEDSVLQQWMSQTPAHIIFTVSHRHVVRHHWRQRLTMVDIPLPDAELRLRLWQQAFSNGVKGMGNARWTSLAEEIALSTQQIAQIFRRTKELAGEDDITIQHLKQVLADQGHVWKPR